MPHVLLLTLPERKFNWEGRAPSPSGCRRPKHAFLIESKETNLENLLCTGNEEPDITGGSRPDSQGSPKACACFHQGLKYMLCNVLDSRGSSGARAKIGAPANYEGLSMLSLCHTSGNVQDSIKGSYARKPSTKTHLDQSTEHVFIRTKRYNF